MQRNLDNYISLLDNWSESVKFLQHFRLHAQKINTYLRLAIYYNQKALDSLTADIHCCSDADRISLINHTGEIFLLLVSLELSSEIKQLYLESRQKIHCLNSLPDKSAALSCKMRQFDNLNETIDLHFIESKLPPTPSLLLMIRDDVGGANRHIAKPYNALRAHLKRAVCHLTALSERVALTKELNLNVDMKPFESAYNDIMDCLANIVAELKTRRLMSLPCHAQIMQMKHSLDSIIMTHAWSTYKLDNIMEEIDKLWNSKSSIDCLILPDAKKRVPAEDSISRSHKTPKR